MINSQTRERTWRSLRARYIFMSGEAPAWNINILKLTKVKAFIPKPFKPFLVRCLVSAKKLSLSLWAPPPSPLSFRGWITAHCSLLPAKDEDDGAILLADLIERARRRSNRTGVSATKRWRYLTLICARMGSRAARAACRTMSFDGTINVRLEEARGALEGSFISQTSVECSFIFTQCLILPFAALLFFTTQLFIWVCVGVHLPNRYSPTPLFLTTNEFFVLRWKGQTKRRWRVTECLKIFTSSSSFKGVKKKAFLSL